MVMDKETFEFIDSDKKIKKLEAKEKKSNPKTCASSKKKELDVVEKARLSKKSKTRLKLPQPKTTLKLHFNSILE